MTHPTSLRCHLLHLQCVYLSPAAPRHLQASRHLPHPSLLYSAAPVLPDARCRLLRPPPALPALWAFGHCMAWGPAGKEGFAAYLQHRPPHLPPVSDAAPSGTPPRQTIIKRPKESQAPAVYSLPSVFPLSAGPPSRRRCRLGCRGLHGGFPGHSEGAGPPCALLAADSPAGSLCLPQPAGTEAF